MFHSIMFKKHLLLEHFEDAYISLSANPDSDMRKDCLRELVGVLFARKKLDLLLSFPYVDFYEDFQNIVEGRARASDIVNTQYYNFLYSFYVNSGNMRKGLFLYNIYICVYKDYNNKILAASIMYEQACRLKLECPSTMNTLQKQRNCLLATITSLHLVSSSFRFLVRPQEINTDIQYTSKRDKSGDVCIRFI